MFFRTFAVLVLASYITMGWKDISEGGKIGVIGIIITVLTLINSYQNDRYSRTEHIRQTERELLDSALAECTDYMAYLRGLTGDSTKHLPFDLLPRISRRVAFDPLLVKAIDPFIRSAISFDSSLENDPTPRTRAKIIYLKKLFKIDYFSDLAVDIITKKYREVSKP